MPLDTVTAATLKQRFGEVRRAALHEGPVQVTHHGRPDLVVLSVDDYERLRRAPAAVVPDQVEAVDVATMDPETLDALLDEAPAPDLARHDHELDDSAPPPRQTARR